MNLTIKLNESVTAGSEIFSELTLRELTVSELIEHERATSQMGEIETDVMFFSRSCGVPPDAIKALKQRDWVRLRNLYWQTLGKSDPVSTTVD